MDTIFDFLEALPGCPPVALPSSLSDFNPSDTFQQSLVNTSVNADLQPQARSSSSSGRSRSGGPGFATATQDSSSANRGRGHKRNRRALKRRSADAALPASAARHATYDVHRALAFPGEADHHMMMREFGMFDDGD